MISYWLLTIVMVHGQVEHGHLIDKANCMKLGQNLTKIVKPSTFSCKRIAVKVE